MSPGRAAIDRPARRPWRWPLRRGALRALAIGGGALLAIAGGVHLWRAGMPLAVAELGLSLRQDVIALGAQLGLRVGEVFVEGRSETPAHQVLGVLGTQRGAPILAVDPVQTKARLEQLPWVRSAAVERRLPDTIYIRIVERQPLALWQLQGRMVVVDRDGVEIRGADIRRFSQLPLIVGDDAPRHAATLIGLLSTEPALHKRVAAAVRVAGRRWNLRLDNGIDVKLPEANAGAAWVRLAEIEREQRVLSRNISVVDLRLPDRMVVEVGRDAAPQPQPPQAPRRGAVPGKPT